VRPGAATARAPGVARVADEVLDLDKAANTACQIDRARSEHSGVVWLVARSRRRRNLGAGPVRVCVFESSQGAGAMEWRRARRAPRLGLGAWLSPSTCGRNVGRK
jgi:hypothetical protein